MVHKEYERQIVNNNNRLLPQLTANAMGNPDSAFFLILN
jgi:hypothetical protein